MNKMKKIMAALLSLSMCAVCFTGCGDINTSESETENSATSVSVDNNLTAADIMEKAVEKIETAESVHAVFNLDEKVISNIDGETDTDNATGTIEMDITKTGVHTKYDITQTCEGESETYQYEEYDMIYTGDDTESGYQSTVYTNDSDEWEWVYYDSTETVTTMLSDITDILSEENSVDMHIFDTATVNTDDNGYVITISVADILKDDAFSEMMSNESENTDNMFSEMFSSVSENTDSYTGSIELMLDTKFIPVTLNISDFSGILVNMTEDFDGDGTDNTYRIDTEMSMTCAFKNWNSVSDVVVPENVLESAVEDNSWLCGYDEDFGNIEAEQYDIELETSEMIPKNEE